MTRLHRHRGFTLIELIVSMAIVLLAIALAGAGFAAQNQALQAFDLSRIANSASRDALLNLEGTLRTVGWGVDPRYAIDLRTPVAGSVFPSVDSATAPDELAFVSRSPLYQWAQEGGACAFASPDGSCPGTCGLVGGCFATGSNAWRLEATPAGTPVTVNIKLGSGQVIEKGRTVLVVCLGGERPVMITSAGRLVGTGAAVNITGDSTITFPYNEAIAAFTSTSVPVCHNIPGGAVFLIDRYRYFVQSLADASSPSGFTPWLMLDTGLDLDADGNLPPGDTGDLIPVAKNVEDFQVGYVLNIGSLAPDVGATPDWIIGNDPGTVELPVGPTASGDLPLYSTVRGDASRLNTNSANVRAIRASVVLRSARTDLNQAPYWTGDAQPALENRALVAPGDRLRRWVSQTEITLRNMDSVRNFTF